MIYSFYLNDSGIQNLNLILSLIKKQTRVNNLSHRVISSTYYDTFDWRLYNRGLYLYTSNKELVLYDFLDKRIVKSDSPELSQKKDILELSGKMEKTLSPIIGFRALLHVATFHRDKQIYHILNSDDKTIGHLSVLENKIKKGRRILQLNPEFEFQPLKGYDKDVKLILKKIPKRRIAPADTNLLEQGLKTLKNKPGSYTSKFNISLRPELSSDKALKVIYLHLLDIMKQNENGILKDYDTEFLHDFRVAIRRTRSGLSQLKNILDSAISLQAKKDFAYLGRATNSLRDIDVYLLNESSYRNMLPTHLQKNLDPFFLALKQERIKEHRALVRLLRSKKYELILNNWEQYLKNEESPEETHDLISRPIIEIAREVIWKRNQRIIKFGKKILHNSSDELLHKLRIEAKKLRYLLEFFSSLFPQNRIHRLIYNLKQLQDNLGEFNDLVVQQNSLKHFSESKTFEVDLSRETILTLGILIGKLYDLEKRVKKAIAKKFNLYVNQDIQKIYVELFQVKG